MPVPNEPQKENTISALVADLPEIYQPIYGYPEFTDGASRKCEDRLALITHIYKLLEAKLGRPLRVLDLGCAQGFFSLSLAALGASVIAIDFQKPNIDLCQALAAENPSFKVRFQLGRIEEVVVALEAGQCDLVLGFSVFHHIVHATGIDFVQKMLAILAKKTTAALYEMALSTEPLYWAQSQPTDVRQLLIGYAFVHEMSRQATHLSGIERPIYIASNFYWFLDNEVEAFQSWTTQSHILSNDASQGARRYYIAKDKIAKVFYLGYPKRRDIDIKEYEKEVSFLKNPLVHYPLPHLLTEGAHTHELWLVREKLPGELLVDLIATKKPYDADKVIKDILNQLTLLETAGLYHNDLRSWNVLIGENGHATLIDYGAISHEKTDCSFPYNIYLAFVLFIRDILSKELAIPIPMRSPLLNPDELTEPYRSLIWELFDQPPEAWSFAFIKERFLDLISGNTSPHPSKQREGLSLVLKSMEEAFNIYRHAIGAINQKLTIQGSKNPLHFQESGADSHEIAAPTETKITKFWR